MTLSRRDLLLGLASSAVASSLAPLAWATSAQALSLSELVHRSRHTLLATPLEAEGRWESLAGSRRIVTYTKIAIEQSADARGAPAGEVWVRTLGGKVGHIAQLVHGEARLALGRSALLFVDRDPERVYRVTGMAQGHYPLELDRDGTRRLLKSPDLPELKLMETAAVRLLPGRSLLEAQRLLETELGRAR